MAAPTIPIKWRKKQHKSSLANITRLIWCSFITSMLKLNICLRDDFLHTHTHNEIWSWCLSHSLVEREKTALEHRHIHNIQPQSISSDFHLVDLIVLKRQNIYLIYLNWTKSFKRTFMKSNAKHAVFSLSLSLSLSLSIRFSSKMTQKLRVKW